MVSPRQPYRSAHSHRRTLHEQTTMCVYAFILEQALDVAVLSACAAESVVCVSSLSRLS